MKSKVLLLGFFLMANGKVYGIADENTRQALAAERTPVLLQKLAPFLATAEEEASASATILADEAKLALKEISLALDRSDLPRRENWRERERFASRMRLRGFSAGKQPALNLTRLFAERWGTAEADGSRYFSLRFTFHESYRNPRKADLIARSMLMGTLGIHCKADLVDCQVDISTADVLEIHWDFYDGSRGANSSAGGGGD